MMFQSTLHIRILSLIGGFFLCLLPSPLLAIVVQDMVTGGVTTTAMQTALQGQNVTISNLVVVNNGCNVAPAIGLFSQGTTATGAGPVLGDTDGVVLSSGVLNGADPLVSPNNFYNWTNTLCGANVSDADMLILEPATQWGEYAAIEFDVVPTKAIMAIPFQFGSDEFPEYVCTAFNDAVGIFVSGPGIAGPYSLGADNFAKTAAGDLTSINWVNTGAVGFYGSAGQCGSLANSVYYTDNSSGNAFGGNTTVATTNANLELDGWTNYIYQPINVTPGATYHVKAVIADAGDQVWDSAVFFHLIFSTDTFSGFDFGDAPDSYRTLTSNGGASHGIDANLYLGLTIPDNEVTGAPSIAANLDDITGIPDDEDGVTTFPTLIASDTSYNITVVANNTSGVAANLVAWIDFNGNGQFDAAEGTTVAVPNGSINSIFTLSWTGLTGVVAGVSYARLRLTTATTITINTPGGNAPDGEVEDYIISILSTPDYGDAPDSYQTLVASGGAVHGIYPSIFLGINGADTEATGSPSVAANGDDVAGSDDEDGVATFATLSTGSSSYTVNATASNTTGKPAVLIAWIDFNRNGNFEASEAASVAVPTGSVGAVVTLNWTGLSGLIAGQTYVRLRLSTDITLASTTPAGAMVDGEVEDYTITITPSADFGDAPDSYQTRSASNGASHSIDANIFMGALPPDTEVDGQPSVNADGDDLTGSADEDGITGGFPALTISSVNYTINVTVTNTSGSPATLIGWIDFNGNGNFETTEAASIAVANGTTAAVVSLNWTGLSGLTVGASYARLRLSTDPLLTTATPAGSLLAGEVEDYPLTIFNAMGEACIIAGATAYYPWNGNTNDFAGVYNLVAGTATFNTLDYVSLQSAVFNGSSDQLQYSDGTFMNQKFTNMSIMFWVKPTALAGIQTLFDEGGGTRGVTLRLNAGNLEAGTRDGGGLQTLTTPFPTDGKWHFVAFVYAKGNLTLYLDGVAVANVASGFGALNKHGDTGAFGATNGNDAFRAGAGNFFAGMMDEAVYYYTAVAAADILTTYNCLRPRYDYGDAPASYGASDHKIVTTLYLGNNTDGDTGNWGNGTDGNGNATDDDTAGDPTGGIDDEDGVNTLTDIPISATAFSVDVYVTNTTTATATLFGWIDFNQNGLFESTEAATTPVTTGSNNAIVTLNWAGLTGLSGGTVYLRLRISTDASITTATPTGSAIDGETEDYQLLIKGMPNLSVTKLAYNAAGAATITKAAPSSTVLYIVQVSNIGNGSTGNDSIVISDPFSAYTSLVIDFDGTGPIAGPIQFVDLASSGVTYTYPTDINFYNAAGTAITPVAGSNGTDPLVRKIVINPKGAMPAAGASTAAFQIKFKMIVH